VMGVGLGLRASDASPALTEPALFATWVSVSPKYFELMGMPIRAGRTFSQTDRTGAAKVIILSRNAVAKLWPDSDMVIGKQVDVSAFRGKSTRYDVVGVVDDVRFGGPRYQPRGAAYVPFAQEGAYGGISLIVKAGPSPGRIEEQLRSALQSRDAEVPAFGVRSVREAVDQFVARERLALVVCATFAGLTVLLVAIGLYGVLTQSVARRTREIGVRLALGADRGRVLWLVVRDGQRLVAIGLTCGLGVAWLALRALPRLAPDVVAPATSALTVPVGVLVVAGLIAAWMPARRAASVDPLRALKDL
jgi:putative ABC transport system permease protein